MASATKKRKENWSKAEQEALKCAYYDRASTVDGRLGQKLHAADKERCWREIEDSVNAQGTCQRTLEECKKKLSDIKTEVKKKERRRRQMAGATGGGPAPVLEDWEDKMVQIIGETAVGGFAGVDTFRLSSGTISNITSVNCDTMESIIPIRATAVLPTSVDYLSYNPPIQDLLEADCAPPQKDFQADCPQTLSNQVEISFEPVVNKRSQSGRGTDSTFTDDGFMSMIQEQNQLLSQILEQQKITNDLLMASMTLKN